jgi:hypothetical protein
MQQTINLCNFIQAYGYLIKCDMEKDYGEIEAVKGLLIEYRWSGW